MKTFKFYSDPGHGWLAVKRADLVELGILDKVTAYSYQSKSGKTVYLEEDADASLFIKAYEEKYGQKPVYEESYSKSSGVRSYPRFEAKNSIDLTIALG